MSVFSFIMYGILAAALLLAIWALRIAQFYIRRVSKMNVRPLLQVYPKVAVILPIKGVEADTATNIQGLLHLDYPHYRLIFAVESSDDPVVSLLEKLATDAPPGMIKIVIAGHAENRGQKIHNQLAAVEQTTETDEILAFMDADAKIHPQWLHALINPLNFGEYIGATTGYRFYIPMNNHLASVAVSIINAGVAMALGPYRRTFAWGGSMALRRKDFFSFGIFEAWQSALSDDYVVSYCVKKLAHRKIHFVPRCLVVSEANFNWSSFFEFATRQYKITRICAPLVWLAGICGPTLLLVALLYSAITIVRCLITPSPDENIFRIGSIFIALYGLYILRGYMMLRSFRKRWPEYETHINKLHFWITFGYPIIQFINLLGFLGSAFGRTIVWRGITYIMLSRTKTLVKRSDEKKHATNAHALVEKK